MPNHRFLFCNVGWMSRYEGSKGKPDKIVGGGRWIEEHGTGGEVCNFLQCSDGYVYGYVETDKAGTDREIRIDTLGAHSHAKHVDGITVVWTATEPNGRGRRVVGWYKDAGVWRARQPFQKIPSRQHKADGLDSFRIRARASNVFLIPVENRVVRLQFGKGWMGHAEWWFPHLHSSGNVEIALFLRNVEEMIDGVGDDDPTEVLKIKTSKTLSVTQKKALLDARIGQGKFRRFLLHEWAGCAVLGCKVQDLLRASHIKPWSIADNRERLDPNNGLLLIASLDAAFENGLITFSDAGNILISTKLSTEDRRFLGITRRSALRIPPSEARQGFLQWHRTERFQA